MKILVTGGAGFIGSHVADVFLKKGYRVDIVDNLSTGNKSNVPEQARFFQHSVSDPAVKELLEERYDVICHYAAQIDVRKSLLDPIGDLREDVVSAAQLFRWAAETGVQHVVFSSSGGAIYGEQQFYPADETHPIRPDSPYGLHKWFVEKYLDYYYKNFGMGYSALRYANIYGPRQNSKAEAGVIAIFSERLLSGTQSVINGTGRQTRDFVYVGDAVRAAALAVEKRFCGPANIGTGLETSINTIYTLLKRAAGSDMQAEHGPAKQGEQMRSVLSHELARAELGWEPEVLLKEGLERTVKFFINQKNRN